MNTRKPVILLAPLDWGLGHTVRCIPIIRELLERGCEVLVGCNSKQITFLRNEFPSIRFVHLDGYNISYGGNRLHTLLKLMAQTGKILTSIKREHRWLRTFLSKNKIDAVISDNRYGLYSSSIPSIFITHQLRVKSGLGRLIDSIIQSRLYRYIDRFSFCWVPDFSNEAVSIAGALSHPQHLPAIPVKYIGCLSSFQSCGINESSIDILAILSGPEPQRSILEKTLIDQLSTFPGKSVIVRGIVDDNAGSPVGKTKVVGIASREHLSSLISNAQIVICRSGYTSIMDVLKLGKKCIVIPTPGQTEQEYLAQRLHHRSLAWAANQSTFCLSSELEKLRQMKIAPLFVSMENYKEFVAELVQSLKASQSESADFGNSKK